MTEFISIEYSKDKNFNSKSFKKHDPAIVRFIAKKEKQGFTCEIKPALVVKKRLTILIRTHAGREALFQRCIDSVTSQTYQNIQIFVNEDGYCPYLAGQPIQLRIRSTNTGGFSYNLFCNHLKALVSTGYFLFLDSDDYLNGSNVIEDIMPLLDPDKANIVQMWRDDTGPKPFDSHIDEKRIVYGKIGLPCLILHHSNKNIANVGDKEDSDFYWIESVLNQLGGNFIKQIIVNSPHRNYGQ